MEDTSIIKLLLKLSPPVMLALLIQSIYNIIDSFFVAQYSANGLTALSIIFPIQLLMTALATGTGTGINILLSRMDGMKDTKNQNSLIKNGLFLGVFNYLVFIIIGITFIDLYYGISSNSLTVQTLGIQYARIIFVGSIGQFIEAICTKILQAKGNMFIPMLAQIIGAMINVILDPLLIFGIFYFPKLGIAGAAIATIVGQLVAMIITLTAVWLNYPHNGKISFHYCIDIYKSGIPSIIMQSLYTLYIVGLNLILKQFNEDAVTVLGIYYKLQTFFFIPLMGLQQVILPIISFNYGARKEKRVNDVLKYVTIFSCGIMVVATYIFMRYPCQLLSIFTKSKQMLHIGKQALPIISLSFVPAGMVMMFTVYFQGIRRGKDSLKITILRQIFLLVPLAWILHFMGLNYVWYTFVITEVIAMIVSIILYKN